MSTSVNRPLHSVESRGTTHLESIGLRNALSSPWVGQQAHGNSNPPSKWLVLPGWSLLAEKSSTNRQTGLSIGERSPFRVNIAALSTAISLIHANKLRRAKAVVPRRKDCHQGPPKRQNQNRGDTAMDSSAPQAVAVGSLLPPVPSCKGLSESNSGVVGVFPAVGTTGLALFRLGRAGLSIRLLRAVWERSAERLARRSPCGQIRGSV
jgi:hypothetical protein